MSGRITPSEAEFILQPIEWYGKTHTLNQKGESETKSINRKMDEIIFKAQRKQRDNNR